MDLKNSFNLLIIIILGLCICGVCVGCGSKKNNTYGSTIASLDDAETYAFLEMDYKNDVLVTTDMIYDEGTEKQAALYCNIYYASGDKGSLRGSSRETVLEPPFLLDFLTILLFKSHLPQLLYF